LEFGPQFGNAPSPRVGKKLDLPTNANDSCPFRNVRNGKKVADVVDPKTDGPPAL